MAPDSTAGPVLGSAVADDDVLAVLRGWLPAQRWYPVKGSGGDLARVAVVPLVDPLGEAVVGLHLFGLPAGGVLQVPVVLRAADAERPTGPAHVGTVARPGGALVVLDGCQDPAFLRAWLAAAHHDVPVPDVDLAAPGAVRGLGGEQSNTSVLLPTLPTPAILKVFRAVSPGANPDVEVPLALHHAGWGGVPRPLAWLEGRWPDAREPDGLASGHLGVLSELVLGAQDGFELACRLAAQHTDLGDLALDLGRTTAQMHTALRTALPVPDADLPADAAAVVAMLRSRAAAAEAVAPVLAERAAGIEAVLSAVGRVGALPPVQRVHGDYHLGQVLRAPDRWAVLDFEGEPQATAAERARPDLALRDLAGMLRSVDYAAAVGGARPGWADLARARLVEGYREQLATDDAATAVTAAAAGVLLRALELDKALYEVVYEVRNRPDWVDIPLGAVDHLLAGDR
ncbi:aminoglycoside phosphotransferase [Actinotalea sp.]|uniref:maltokinase N-terminal cap-like domain-containing protein n=1 Tax=Actinotalea sp. TaxID=1872145 RepID=UPI002BF3EC78|nr:aminoglycoside phosphotransferase [Actinotalea sp.]HQY33658.1 aminoglycoside phosphotransferase [Actinotalea sp.]HRA50227.1 aminoglycoside phosphotransferase [Actinotalea sp.]